MKKLALLLVLLFSFALLVNAAEKAPADKAEPGKAPAAKKALDPALDKQVREAITKGVNFLVANQAENGGWNKQKPHPGVTALALSAILGSPQGDNIRKQIKENKAKDSPTALAVSKGLSFLKTFVKEDGGIYDKETPNYITCVALMAFVAADDKQYEEIIRKAQGFIKGLQFAENKGVKKDDVKYGGIGYGSDQRPDLSNTQYAIEALRASGLKEDDEALKKAIIFLQRCQNRTESNDTEKITGGKVKVNDDGGAAYQPDTSKASDPKEAATKGLRSYGSMTYAFLKSMIHCGVDKKDPRVTAAQQWVMKHYTLEENPEMGLQGLFYYYHTFAKAMDVLGETEVVDSKGQKHDWRVDLAKKLIAEQNKDGFWVNAKDRWWEADPSLVTSYSLMSLAYCLK